MLADRHLLAHVIEHTPIGILIVRRDTTVAFVNQYALDLFGAVREDLIGNTLGGMAGHVKSEFDADSFIKNAINGTLTNFKLTLSLNERPDIVCLLNSFMVDAVDPYPECVALIVRDITREQAAADLIEAKNIEMAKINSELIRSNAELKKISELKSNFLSIASHELNTPLTSIKGYSDIIIDNMEAKIEPSIFRMIGSISRAADRLHRVVNNILDVTKIEQGRLRLRPEQIDLGAIMRDCCDEICQIAEKRGITFNLNIDASLPQFYGDRSRMHQVFTNLFNNAVKYSPDGSRVDASLVVEDENRFHITVADHGIGIDKNEQKNIFDPFYEIGCSRHHSTSIAKFMGGGSGLGLSIVRGIVGRHGGKVWVESEGTAEGEFHGSVFHITLPLHSNISRDDDESYHEEDESEEASDISFDKMSDEGFGRPAILFIDPDKESIATASMAIENIFDVLEAESGEQGLIIAFSHKPSLILMDSRLPGLDGYRICKILRSQEETKNIPIAFFSAVAEDAEIQKCFACGADDFIVKPFSGRELVEKICRLLMKK
jgi:signal transduction histidine kinase/CheY-like chemotaxis protein